MSPSYYFHDYETFGFDPHKDRAVQFAGQRTDLDFNPIGEPLMLYCQPGDEQLPSPGACLITGITPQLAQREGVSEAEFIHRIHAAMVEPLTCTLGYNNFRFDDEFTRNLLYRNLYDPYTREWKNGNSRFDLIDLLRMVYALRPDGINWPQHDSGQPSFKLEDLSKANAISHDAAHDAMSDVHATIGLAKLLATKQPKLWQWALSLRQTRSVQQLLSRNEPLLHSSGKYPNTRGGTALVLPLGVHPRIKNQFIVYDLMTDPAQFAPLSASELQDLLYTATADLPEDLQRLPIKTVKSNRAPMLAPMSTLKGVDCERIELDLNRCLQHAEALNADPLLKQRICTVMEGSDFPETDDPDRMLYQGFLPDQDRYQLSQLRETPIEQWPQQLPKFIDPRLPELLFRYKARNFPHSLNLEEQQRWQQWRKKSLNDPDRLNLDNYMAVLKEHRDAGDDIAILDQLESWYRRLVDSLG